MPLDNRSESEYLDTPEGWSARWQMELNTARTALKDFYKVAQDVDEALRDEQQDNGGKRLCLYQSGHQTIAAQLYGRMPQANATRKFADADDDAARVAAEMLERILNCDIERADDTFAEATRNAMMDWRGPGLGIQRHRYELGPMDQVDPVPAKADPLTGQELAPAVPASEKKSWERVNTDYVHYRDFLWGMGSRTWPAPWVAFLAQMPREKLVERFGEDIGNKVPLNSKRRDSDGKDSDKSHPWDRADVWEIWHKETEKVFWVVEGFDQTLDIKEDPLELEGFFPCQRPMMANLTTSKLIPVADYKFAQDLYRSVDTLTTRIGVLAKAVRVAGAYAKEAGTIVEKLVQGGENTLYPVDEWAALMEKGGTQGIIVYLPLEQIVATLTQLRDLRREDIDLIYQVTGQSDLMRGQQTTNGTPGEAKVKAKFGSVRMQAMQDELARFASDGQRIRAEIICKHFSPETIIEHSNIMRTQDAQYAQAAVQLLQSRFADYRIEVKPEAINLTDFAALKAERMEVLDGIAGFFQRMAPVAQAMGPQSQPFILKMLQVSLAGLKGGSAYESIIDQAIHAAEQAAQQAAANPQQAPPDPKVQAQQLKMQGDQMKGQMDMQKESAKLQGDLVRINAEQEADGKREQVQAYWNTQEANAKALVSHALKPPTPPGGTQR